MSELLRFGVSMETELLAAFDRLIEKRQYTNRSEALRDLVRESLAQTRWKKGKEVVTAALCLVHSPAGPKTAAALAALLARNAQLILNRMQIPLEDGKWFDVLALRGKATDLQTFADKVSAVRGVRNAHIFPAIAD